MTYQYTAYGLRVASQIPLPELLDASFDVPDVLITVEQGFYSENGGPAGNEYRFGSDRARMAWTGVGAFDVVEGRAITIYPASGVDASLIRLPLMGTVFGALLHQRGLAVLHASAVKMGGKAIAFVGQKGAGKSTTVAALCARGYLLLADDILAVDLHRKERPVANPAFPRVKLWPDSVAAALGTDPEDLPVMHRRVTKRSWQAEDSFHNGELPLGAIYVLESGPFVSVDTMPAQEAFVEVVRHSNCSQYMDNRTIAGMIFPRARRIVRAVPVRRLTRSESLHDIDSLVHAVEADVASASEEFEAQTAGGNGFSA